MNPISPEEHIAIVTRLVLASPDRKIGRTQLMKLCYFLQEIEDLPLRYDFRLFNYGPFDSEVLQDLGSACGRNALNEQTVTVNRGYRYDITPGERAEAVSGCLSHDLVQKVDRMAQAFGGDGAGEMELKSTILFVDREFARDQVDADAKSIAIRVQSIKPRFELEMIQGRVESMKSKGFLLSF